MALLLRSAQSYTAHTSCRRGTTSYGLKNALESGCQSSHTAARPIRQADVQKIRPSTILGSVKTPVSFSVTRPDSTV
jgi:protein involved in polysaccharide export with SLBB domain